VVECSGHEQAVLDAGRVVRKRGEVVLVGVPWRRRSELFAHELLDVLFHNYVVLRGGWEWELPRQPTDFLVNSIYGNFAGALKWLAQGRVRVDGLASKAAPADAQQAYQDLLHGRAPGLTYVFDWGACR
jgi:threonine dehydrogenase-like Zn-dependent dehydrogenase